MKETWRWFGPNDPVSLQDIRQAGASGIVTALHDLPNGAVWPIDAIQERKAMIEAAGLSWDVVESIPIHEDIKTGAEGWETHAQAWATSLRNLARCGIGTVCYNFMPILDWTRTELDYPLPCGAQALRFDYIAYAAFDLYVLKRPGAEQDYSAEDQQLAQLWLEERDEAAVERLTNTILAGLPGSEESYDLDRFSAQLALYQDVTPAQLKARLAAFLDIVVPVAQELGVQLAIHPDDPPRPLFGLPRIVSSLPDLQDITAMVDAPENGVTFCAGSLGAVAENDLVEIVQTLGPRIHFCHLRSTQREEDPRSFHEAAHLEGDANLVALAALLKEISDGRDTPLPFRPDHGHKLLSDLTSDTTPGYPAVGRLRGLAELRGVLAALTWQQDSQAS